MVLIIYVHATSYKFADYRNSDKILQSKSGVGAEPFARGRMSFTSYNPVNDKLIHMKRLTATFFNAYNVA